MYALVTVACIFVSVQYSMLLGVVATDRITLLFSVFIYDLFNILQIFFFKKIICSTTYELVIQNLHIFANITDISSILLNTSKSGKTITSLFSKNIFYII